MKLANKFLFILALSLVLAPVASAQLTYSGSVYGRVTDNTGAALPGVLVTLESPAILSAQTATTGASGSYRFAGLPPGSYKVTAKLDGYNTVVRDGIRLALNTSANVNVEMSIAAVAETVTVTGEAPLIQAKSNSVSSSFTQTALEEIPSARDPWAIFEQAPGIMTDRFNIGGNESGQQSNFVAKGDDGDNAMWSIDGVNITDPSALGASPTYFDFSSFQEMQITTAGADPSLPLAGVAVNIVTKQGGNRFSGNGHLFVTDNDLQSDNVGDLGDEPCPSCPDRTLGSAGNEIVRVTEFGFDVGGPAIKDRLWFWGSYSKNDIRNKIITGARDDTQLENFVVKFNGQVTDKNTATVFHHRGDKTKQGRNVGPTRPPETSWNQAGPSPITKIEDQHIFSDNFFLAGKLGIIKGGFSLAPQGGLNRQVTWDFTTGVWGGSFQDHSNSRPHYTGNFDGNYFLEGAGGDHEFKFGYSFSQAEVTNNTQWPLDYFLASVRGSGYGYVYIYRNVEGQGTQGIGHGFYFGDTWTRDRLTLNLGVRYDRQDTKNLENSWTGSQIAPDLVPGGTFPGNDPGYVFNDIVPRIGFTYDITGDGKTLIRGNFAMYAGLGGLGDTGIVNGGSLGYLSFGWVDQNGDGVVQRAEIGGGPYGIYNIDPDDPASPQNPNAVDPDLTADHTMEFTVGVDREIMPDLAVSASYIWRRLEDFSFDRRIGEDPNNTVPGTTLCVGSVCATPQVPGPGVVLGPGVFRSNNDFYHESYNGFELSATKRLSNKWMASSSFTWGDHIAHYEDFVQASSLWNTAGNVGNYLKENLPFLDGETVLIQSQGSGDKGDVFLSSKYQFKLSGLYVLPYNWTVGGFYLLRDGYLNPQYISSVARPQGLGRAINYVEPVGDRRLDDVHLVNLRIEKNTSFGEGLNLGVGIDIFNAFNSNEIIQRRRVINTAGRSVPNPQFDQIKEIISPRVIRLGARFSF